MFDEQAQSVGNLVVDRIEHPLADVWIGWVNHSNFDYNYGGTRMMAPYSNDENALTVLRELAVTESLFKNLLINGAMDDGALDVFRDRLPAGMARSRVGGARCVIRPRNDAVHKVLGDPAHPQFATSVRPVFAEIGNYLNGRDGQIKLTPDFGRYALVSDILREFTPHVLGVACEVGGCGGKTSYATTGVVAAYEHFGFPADIPTTLIGSAGAMGSEFLRYLRGQGSTDLAIADIAYGRASDPELPPDGLPLLSAEAGRFTEECLGRGGLITAVTWGRELANSDLSVFRPGTNLLLAHNLSIPSGEKGIELMRKVAERDVFALPGQILTLGGALTARLEWFWRQARPNQPFDKELAHEVVRAVVSYWMREVVQYAKREEVTPYEAVLSLAQIPPHGY